MWNRFKNALRRTSVRVDVDPDTPIALYFAPSGRVSPITLRSIKGMGWGGYDALQNSMARPNSNGNATPSELGYAYMSEVNVWVRRCIEIRASNIARLDWYVKDKVTGKRIENHPMMVAINRARHFFLRYERSMDIWGEVYLKPVMNQFRYYSDVWWLNNLSINFAIVNGQIDQFYFVPLHGGKPYVWQPEQVAYIYNENAFDDLRGSSRILSILAEANVHEEISRSAQAHFANDARPGIMFLPEIDLGIPQAQEFLDYWKANFQGSLNTNKPVMLPMQIKSIQTIERATLKDDVELRGSIRREICAAFGVPLSIAGAWDDANYQSAPEQRKSLYEDTLIPESDQIGKDIDRVLLPFYGDPERESMCYDAKKLLALAEDKQAKAVALNSQLVSGGITLNQYREALDLEAIPQGNVFYIPSGVIVTPLEKLGNMPPPAQPGGFGFNSAPPAAPLPELPAGTPPLNEPPAKSGNKVSVTLSLANDADCIALQQRLKELYAAVPMQWTDPNDFHITLISIPLADEQQAQQLVNGLDMLEVNAPLTLPIGSLASFDNVGEHALHFRIRRNQALLDLQEDVYLAAQNAGCQLSSYSDPRTYIPHVTMGYAPQHIRAIAFHSKLSVTPVCMTASTQVDGSWQELKRVTFAPPVSPVETPIASEDEPPQMKSGDALEELNAFRKFHLARWGKPTRAFNFEWIGESIQTELNHALDSCATKEEFRHTLQHIQDDMTRAIPITSHTWVVGDDATFSSGEAGETINLRASDEDIVTPEQAQEWWGDYDRLLKQLGNDWLRDYMREVWRKLEPRLNGNIETGDVKELLNDFHPELIEKWTGTADDPGVIAKLFMAGMGAGQAALERSRTNMNPAKAIEIEVDWTLVPSDAIAAVQKYVGKLIRGIDKTTLAEVQKIIEAWLESGQPVSELSKQLNPIFNDTARADAIAHTESSNAYNSGAVQRWQDVGVKKMKFRTVQDSKVCSVCRPLAGQVADIEVGWWSDILNDYVWIPVHVFCRCYASPVMD
jgi:HK97 family phage portal protein